MAAALIEAMAVALTTAMARHAAILKALAMEAASSVARWRHCHACHDIMDWP
jgi:hypothetical protein